MEVLEPDRQAPPCTQTINGARAFPSGRWRSSFRLLVPTCAYSISRMILVRFESPALAEMQSRTMAPRHRQDVPFIAGPQHGPKSDEREEQSACAYPLFPLARVWANLHPYARTTDHRGRMDRLMAGDLSKARGSRCHHHNFHPDATACMGGFG